MSKIALTPTEENEKSGLLRDFYQAIESARQPLLPTDEAYVSNLYSDEKVGPIEALASRIGDSKQSTLNFFTGQRGTGKSTQLQYLKTLLQAGEHSVILIDLAEYVPESEPIDLPTMIVSLAAAVADAVEGEIKTKLTERTYFQRLTHFLNTDVKLEAIEVSAGSSKFKMTLAAHPDFRSKLKSFDENSRSKIVREGRELIAQMCESYKSEKRTRRVALLVDSLERLRDPVTDNGGAVTQSVMRVFYDDRSSLAIGNVDVLYSVPPYISFWGNLTGTVSITTLGSVRVFRMPKRDSDRRLLRKDGFEKMREILQKRFPRWDQVLTSTALNKLVEASGGDIRHFLLNLIDKTIAKARNSLDQLPMKHTDSAFKEIIRRAQSEYEVLVVDSEIPLIASLAQKNAPRVEEREQLRLLARFFENRCILSYQNEDEWVDASPLLWPMIDEYEKDRNLSAPAPSPSP